MSFEIRISEDKSQIEVLFQDKPEADIVARLEEAGFTQSGNPDRWIAEYSANRIAEARSIQGNPANNPDSAQNQQHRDSAEFPDLDPRIERDTPVSPDPDSRKQDHRTLVDDLAKRYEAIGQDKAAKSIRSRFDKEAGPHTFDLLKNEEERLAEAEKIFLLQRGELLEKISFKPKTELMLLDQITASQRSNEDLPWDTVLADRYLSLRNKTYLLFAQCGIQIEWLSARSLSGTAWDDLHDTEGDLYFGLVQIAKERNYIERDFKRANQRNLDKALVRFESLYADVSAQLKALQEYRNYKLGLTILDPVLAEIQNRFDLETEALAARYDAYGDHSAADLLRMNLGKLRSLKYDDELKQKKKDIEERERMDAIKKEQAVPSIKFIPLSEKDFIDLIHQGKRSQITDYLPEGLFEHHYKLLNRMLNVLAHHGIYYSDIEAQKLVGTKWIEQWRMVAIFEQIHSLGSEYRWLKTMPKSASTKRRKQQERTYQEQVAIIEAKLMELEVEAGITKEAEAANQEPTESLDSAKQLSEVLAESADQATEPIVDDEQLEAAKESSPVEFQLQEFASQREALAEQFESLGDPETADELRDEDNGRQTLNSQELQILTWSRELNELKRIHQFKQGKIAEPFEFTPYDKSQISHLISPDAESYPLEQVDEYLSDQLVIRFNKAERLMAMAGFKTFYVHAESLVDSVWTNLWRKAASLPEFRTLGVLLMKAKDTDQPVVQEGLYTLIRAVELEIQANWHAFEKLYDDAEHQVRLAGQLIPADQLANDYGIFTEETAGDRYEQIELLFPKFTRFQATINLAVGSDDRYRFGVDSSKDYGDISARISSPRIEQVGFEDREAALEAAVEELRTRMEVLLAKPDTIITSNETKNKRMKGALGALRKFAFDNGIRWDSSHHYMLLRSTDSNTVLRKQLVSPVYYRTCTLFTDFEVHKGNDFESDFLKNLGFRFSEQPKQLSEAQRLLIDLIPASDCRTIVAALEPRKTLIIAESVLVKKMIEWGVSQGLIDPQKVDVGALLELPYWDENGRCIVDEINIDRHGAGEPLIDYDKLTDAFQREVVKEAGFDSIKMLFEADAPSKDTYEWFVLNTSIVKYRREETLFGLDEDQDVDSGESADNAKSTLPHYQLDPKLGNIGNFTAFIKLHSDRFQNKKDVTFGLFEKWHNDHFPEMSPEQVFASWDAFVMGQEHDGLIIENSAEGKITEPERVCAEFYAMLISVGARTVESITKEDFIWDANQYMNHLTEDQIDVAWEAFERDRGYYQMLEQEAGSKVNQPQAIYDIIRNSRDLREALADPEDEEQDRIYINKVAYNFGRMAELALSRLIEIPFEALVEVYAVSLIECNLPHDYTPGLYDEQEGRLQIDRHYQKELFENQNERLLNFLLRVVLSVATPPAPAHDEHGGDQEKEDGDYLDRIVAHMLEVYMESIRYTKKQIENLREQYNVPTLGQVWEAAELSWSQYYKLIYRAGASFFHRLREMIFFWTEVQPSYQYSDSSKEQYKQYSTSGPIAAIAAEYTEMSKAKSVFDPSAGNGMLLIGADPQSVHANEIDNTRMQSLRFNGFEKITDQDASKPFPKEMEKSFDVVVTNPPFDSWRDDKYTKNHIVQRYFDNQIGLAEHMRLEHMMAGLALRTMKDNGKAVLILMGHISFSSKHKGFRIDRYRPFFNWLYRFYHVDDVINMNSYKLYNKQGATAKTMMVLIRGRKQNPGGTAPTLPEAPHLNTVVESFEELWTRVQNTQNYTLKTLIEQLKISLDL